MDADRLRGLPKAELHQHLDGSLRPETAVELARKLGRPAPLAHALYARCMAQWRPSVGRPDAAAVREVFEETGMLLARDAADGTIAAGAATQARLEDHRRALVRGDRSFTAILTTEGWSADLGPLRYLSHFVTPPASPIRFSARFFLCPVPAGQEPRLIAEEASEGFWVDPAEAHRRFRRGEWPMAEPAEYGTQYLAQFESCEAVWRHHTDGRPAFHGIIDRLDAARYYLFDWSTVVRPA